MLASLIVCLLENKNAHISRLGECLEINSDANIMGCMQRIRRFLLNIGISPTITVLPLIRLMRPLLSNLPEIILAMDRTDWEKRRKSLCANKYISESAKCNYHSYQRVLQMSKVVDAKTIVWM